MASSSDITSSNKDNDDSASEPEILSHEELLEITHKTLNDILKRDPLLSDLPSGVTLEEVQSQISLEHGQSMTVYVVRDDGEEMPVVVHQQGATVIDLKHAIRRHFTLRLQRLKKSSIKISWRYIWRTYWLTYEGVKLKDDQALLMDYGIRNKSRITFVKKLRDKSDTN